MKKLYFFALVFTLTMAAPNVFAQKITIPPITDSNWVKDYPPFRIAGNLYYVGTADLACYLIATPKGNILINTGLDGSEQMIKKHIETLGFKFADTKILLTNQAHYDHVGAIAAIEKMTGAKMEINENDASLLTSGDKDDRAFGIKGSTYAGINPDVLLHDGDIVKLGGTEIKMLNHPGHTKGSSSFLFTVKDDKRSYRVLIANMPSVVWNDADLHGMPGYPNVVQDYDATFQKMKDIHFDLWLAAHAGQFNMDTKHKPGDAYNPMAFADKAGYDNGLTMLHAVYLRRLNKK